MDQVNIDGYRMQCFFKVLREKELDLKETLISESNLLLKRNTWCTSHKPLLGLVLTDTYLLPYAKRITAMEHELPCYQELSQLKTKLACKEVVFSCFSFFREEGSVLEVLSRYTVFNLSQTRRDEWTVSSTQAIGCERSKEVGVGRFGGL